MTTAVLTTTETRIASPQRRTLRPADPDFTELASRIDAAGLLKKNLGYYVLNTAIRLTIFAVSITLLFLLDNFWLQLLDAVFLAFACTQLGYLGHDAGHRQIFNGGAPKNDSFGLGINLMIGLSRSWWIDTHNQHHDNPNDLELDPHTAIPILVFSQEQARERRGLLGRVVGYQAFYFFPMLLLQGIGAKVASFQYLFSRGVKQNALELTIMGTHFILYGWLIFYALGGLGQTVLFITVHQAAFGLYMGSVFAPNHKGMPTTIGGSVGLLRQQVLTTRNVTRSRVNDFWYGGLNYQIEHHLFPSMPRNNLCKAQPIVRGYCQELGIPYHETSAVGSIKEIIESLHEVSAPLREAAA